MSSKEPITCVSAILGVVVGVVLSIPTLKLLNENMYIREILGCIVCALPFLLIAYFIYRINKFFSGEN